MTEALKIIAAEPVLRSVVDEDAQDLFGLLSLCFAEYPGCFVDPHDDLKDLRAPGSHDRKTAFSG
jgi:putative acetyltransferase